MSLGLEVLRRVLPKRKNATDSGHDWLRRPRTKFGPLEAPVATSRFPSTSWIIKANCTKKKKKYIIRILLLRCEHLWTNSRSPSLLLLCGSPPTTTHCATAINSCINPYDFVRFTLSLVRCRKVYELK